MSEIETHLSAHRRPFETVQKVRRATLIVPWCRGQQHVDPFLDGLEDQTNRAYIDEIVFIDSSGDDQTAAALAKRGYDVTSIPGAAFDHGGTRNLGLGRARDAEFALFLSQDAYLQSGAVGSILEVLTANPAYGACFGRQVARPSSSPLERQRREERYPSASYDSNDCLDGRRYHFSNAFAAYRVDALLGIGGFRAPSAFGEDANASWRLQNAGWRVRYDARAVVEHSHPLAMASEFRRHFDAGATSRLGETPPGWASPGSAIDALTAEVRRASATMSPTAPVMALAYSASRAAGFGVGRYGRWLPERLKLAMSHSPSALKELERRSSSLGGLPDPMPVHERRARRRRAVLATGEPHSDHG